MLVFFCFFFVPIAVSEVRALVNRKHIHEALEQVKQALHEYNLSCYPQIQVVTLYWLVLYYNTQKL